jgi:hypothetical protein
MMNKTLLIPLLLALFAVPLVHADLKLDSIQFDPPIIASGDHVDIVAQFHDTGSFATQNYLGNPSYTYKVTLLQDDSLTRQYVLMEDADGQDLQGIITRGGQYNKRFRIKVNDNAPAGNYGFMLTGQWYKDGVPIDAVQYLRFTMPVKKQGIALSVANVVSNPEKVRSGDKNILLTTTLTNTGEKQAKNVRIKLEYPDGITSSYTNNNDLNVGTIQPMGQQQVQFYVDTARFIKEGLYNIRYDLTYQDTDNNNYESTGSFPFVIKKKPNIVITKSEGSGLAGGDATLRVTVQNQGEETADAVDVRILKQSSQPFNMDVRSDYLGQLKPGESGTAVFAISINDGAEMKDHKLSTIIRASGDSSEGDDNIYTFTDAATLKVTGQTPNRYPLYAGIFLGIVIVVAVIAALAKRTGTPSRR